MKRSETNHFDNEQLDFFTRASRVYEAIAQSEKDRVYMIDAMRPEQQIAEEITEIIATKMKHWSNQ